MTKPSNCNDASKLRAVYAEDRSLTSVVSYPTRCSLWGSSRFRGNCDGQLFKNLVLRYGAKYVGDPMKGSGTTEDVVKDLRRATAADTFYWGSDLNAGFDLLTTPPPALFDLVWIHPPYWNIIRYSSHPSDLSNADTYDDYLRKLRTCLKRCHTALMPGGRLAVLVGDVRRSGVYFPISRDVMNLDGTIGCLRSVIVKEQHNCRSDDKRYSRLEDVPIKHEYCVIFKKV